MTSERFQNVAYSLLHKPVWPAPTEMLGLMADTLDSMILCDDGLKMKRESCVGSYICFHFNLFQLYPYRIDFKIVIGGHFWGLETTCQHKTNQL